MLDIVIKQEDLNKLVLEALPKVLKDSLASTYDSPIKKVIDEEIKKQDGVINITIKSIMKDIFESPKLKELIANEVIAEIVKIGIRGR
jgi:hypothetical protein